MSEHYGQVDVPATSSSAIFPIPVLVSQTSTAIPPAIATPTSVIRVTPPLSQNVFDKKKQSTLENVPTVSSVKLTRTLSDVVNDDDVGVVRNFLASESPQHSASFEPSTSNVTLPFPTNLTSKLCSTLEQRQPWCKRICNKASRKNVKEEDKTEQQKVPTSLTTASATISVIKKDDSSQSVCKSGFLGSMLRCHKKKAYDVQKVN